MWVVLSSKWRRSSTVRKYQYSCWMRSCQTGIKTCCTTSLRSLTTPSEVPDGTAVSSYLWSYRQNSCCNGTNYFIWAGICWPGKHSGSTFHSLPVCNCKNRHRGHKATMSPHDRLSPSLPPLLDACPPLLDTFCLPPISTAHIYSRFVWWEAVVGLLNIEGY